MIKNINKIMLFTLIVCIGIISKNVLATNEVLTVNTDIPALSLKHTTATKYKNYDSNQKYYHNVTMSNHDGKHTNIKVRLHNNVSGKYSDWATLGDKAEHVFSTGFKNTGEYYAEIKNSTYSVYTYFTTGYWQYSM